MWYLCAANRVHINCIQQYTQYSCNATLLMIANAAETCWQFISVINQLDAQTFCFTIRLFHASTCFGHMCSSSGGQNCITQHLVSTNSVGDSTVHRTATYRCDDTRCCILMMGTWCSKHVEAWNKIIVKQILCIKLVNYWDKYTEMHGQQNVKECWQLITCDKIYFILISVINQLDAQNFFVLQ